MEHSPEDEPSGERIDDDEREQEDGAVEFQQRTNSRVPRMREDTEEELGTIERWDGDDIEEEEHGVDLKGEREELDEEIICGERGERCDRMYSQSRDDEREDIRKGSRERDDRCSPARVPKRARVEGNRLPPPKSHEEQREEPHEIDVSERVERESALGSRSRISEYRGARCVREFVYTDRDEDGEDPRNADEWLREEIEGHDRS